MSKSDMVEKVARAIYDAEEPLSGDHVATVLISSDHLFPQGQHLEGNPTSKAYQLAAMDVCRTIARAAIEAMMEPDSEVVLHGAKAIADEFDCELEELGGSEFMDFVAAAKSSFKAMLRASLQGDER